MHRIDFFPGLLSVFLLVLLSTPGFAQDSDKTFVISSNAVSAHELSMPEKARNLVASGVRELVRDKNPQGALKEFESAIAKSPGYYEAYYLAGVAYLCWQKQGEAERYLRQAVELSQEKYPEADIALGTMLLDRGDVSGGEGLLRYGLQLNSNSWQGLYALGKLEASRGRLLPALAAAQKAALLAPQKPVLHRLLALIHLHQKNYPALLIDLNAYIQLDPDSPTGAWAKELREETQRQLASAERALSEARK
jgi:tetratricopeptide (TPR) repeat protein